MPRVSGALIAIISILAFLTFVALRPSPLPGFGLIFPILTAIFITSSSLVVTYVAVKAFARERLLSVLFLGCGALVFGCTSLLASAFLGTEGQNFSATVFAMGAVVSAAFNFGCASLTYLAQARRLDRGYHLFLWISLALLSVVSIVISSFEGLVPPFYAVTGSTLLSSVVLGAACFTFASSAALIYFVFSSSKSDVLYWYSLALGADAAGLLGVLVSSGSITALTIRAGWVAFYLGGVLLLKSVLSAESLGHSPVATGNDRI